MRKTFGSRSISSAMAWFKASRMLRVAMLAGLPLARFRGGRAGPRRLQGLRAGLAIAPEGAVPGGRGRHRGGGGGLAAIAMGRRGLRSGGARRRVAGRGGLVHVVVDRLGGGLRALERG